MPVRTAALRSSPRAAVRTSASAADVALGGGSGESNTWFEQINPGTTVKGRIAFDMPKKDKLVKVELHDSMSSGGVTVAST